MPIGKNIRLQKIKEEMTKVLQTNSNTEYKKEFCGRLLMDFARSYSYAEANALVVELNLQEVGINPACPINKKD